jgi:hypothetical protein
MKQILIWAKRIISENRQQHSWQSNALVVILFLLGFCGIIAI